MELSLYSAQGSNSSERVLWYLNYRQLRYQLIEVSADELKTTYRQINPYGYVPFLKIDGHIIAESMAIIECLEELVPSKSLLGNSIFERAAVREICEYVNGSIHSPQNRTALTTFRPDISEAEKKQIRGNWIHSRLAILQQKLCAESEFAIGQQFSVADIFVASINKKMCQHGAEQMHFYDRHLKNLRMIEYIARTEP